LAMQARPVATPIQTRYMSIVEDIVEVGHKFMLPLVKEPTSRDITLPKMCEALLLCNNRVSDLEVDSVIGELAIRRKAMQDTNEANALYIAIVLYLDLIYDAKVEMVRSRPWAYDLPTGLLDPGPKGPQESLFWLKKKGACKLKQIRFVPMASALSADPLVALDAWRKAAK